MILIAAGMAMLWKKKRRGLCPILLGFLITYVFSLPLTAELLTRSLETYPAVPADRLEKAQAIVILGGGERGWAREYGCPMPGKFTLERLCYGAKLARKTALPVLVSGGAPEKGAPEAAVMAKALTDFFDVKTTWIEDRSLDTRDNASYTLEILKPIHIRTIVLVTHAIHMRRAVNEFQREGFDVIPAPTSFFSDNRNEKKYFGLVPSAEAAYRGYYATHEYVGILAQAVRNIFE
jgi:uncharacterized SAM-binding protein YcdF (DUF218 family)